VRVYPSASGISVYAADITDRRRDEERRGLLETVVLEANDAVIITEAEPLDEPGPRILYVNPAFERLSGYSAAEVLGRSPRFLQVPIPTGRGSRPSV
jgi:PAS domain-containing protein